MQFKKAKSKLTLVADGSGDKQTDSAAQGSEDSKLKQLHKKRSSTFTNVAFYENTYRMEPIKSKFFTDKVSKIILETLEDELKDKTYDYATFSNLTMHLSNRVKEKVRKSLDLPRYKVVSFVTIGELKQQGVRVGSRCMWNRAWDYYASSSYTNHSLFAVGVVFAAYFE